jgi:AraC-like DNA-binding protein
MTSDDKQDAVRTALAERATWFGSDPVLAALVDARRRRDQAECDIRVLLAYARELTRPRPYRLTDLAAAAGMSISGVRTAYTREHIEAAERLLCATGEGNSQTLYDRKDI